MNQVFMTKEEQEKIVDDLPDRFAERNNFYNGFLYQWRENLTFDHSDEERDEFYNMLWRMVRPTPSSLTLTNLLPHLFAITDLDLHLQGGFRFLMNNYYGEFPLRWYRFERNILSQFSFVESLIADTTLLTTPDMTRNSTANQHAYNYWRDRVRSRVHDPRKAELLAPTDRPHLFGGKRLSLEQDFYDHFNKPNVDVVDVRTNPIVKFTEDGVVQQDGTAHKLDVIALATGFDSITGGLKDMHVKGVNGEILAEKWKMGTWTYMGISTAGFPNFFFTYGPQAPTAFSNGPSCIEIQADWIVSVVADLHERKQRKIDPTRKSEEQWRELVFELINDTPRGKVDSWYNGANIPGKPREHLNYAGGIPRYKKTLDEVRKAGYEGFVVS